MHLATEVSSTTQMNMDTCGSNASKSTNTNNNSASSSSGNSNNNGGNSGLLTAETLAERTIDGLLAEHPGELVRTGCPHVVNIARFFFFSFSSHKNRLINRNK